jgi:hypothetical protein
MIDHSQHPMGPPPMPSRRDFVKYILGGIVAGVTSRTFGAGSPTAGSRPTAADRGRHGLRAGAC